jgi:ABC-type transporter MlaC component
MRLTKLAFVFLFAAVLIPSGARAEDASRARTQGLIDAFLKVHSPAAGEALTSAQREENLRTYEALDNFFGYDSLMGATLVGIESKLTPADRAEFYAKFRELIRWIAFPNAGVFFRENPYKLGSASARGELSIMVLSSYVKEEDMDMEVAFSWKMIDGELRMVDIEFDGDSLVKDYRNQFSRIVTKEGVAGLLDRIRKKHGETKAEQR